MADLCLLPDQTKNASLTNTSDWNIEKYTAHFTCDLPAIPDGYTQDTGVLVIAENLPAKQGVSREVCRLTGGAPIFATTVVYAAKVWKYSGGQRKTYDLGGTFHAKDLNKVYLTNFSMDVKQPIIAGLANDEIPEAAATGE